MGTGSQARPLEAEPRPAVALPAEWGESLAALRAQADVVTVASAAARELDGGQAALVRQHVRELVDWFAEAFSPQPDDVTVVISLDELR